MGTLNKLRDEIHENAVNKGFWAEPREFGTLLMLCVSELGEALEADRHRRYAQFEQFVEHMRAEDMTPELTFVTAFEQSIKDTVQDELADSIIRILDVCGALNIDIEQHIELKMAYNLTRDKMHGKQY